MIAYWNCSLRDGRVLSLALLLLQLLVLLLELVDHLHDLVVQSAVLPGGGGLVGALCHLRLRELWLLICVLWVALVLDVLIVRDVRLNLVLIDWCWGQEGHEHLDHACV